MNFIDTLAALRPLASIRATANGPRVGFLMADITRALGSLAAASDAVVVLLAEGFMDAEPVVIGDEVVTLYRLTDQEPPAVH